MSTTGSNYMHQLQQEGSPFVCLLEEYGYGYGQLQHQGTDPYLIPPLQQTLDDQYDPSYECNDLTSLCCWDSTTDNNNNNIAAEYCSSWITTLNTSSSYDHHHDQQLPDLPAAANYHEGITTTEKKRKAIYLKAKERKQRKWRDDNMMEDGHADKRSIKAITLSNEKGEKGVNQDDAAACVYVRARRGQATDSHSLAERVRRQKISDRMKLLQSLVPGCDKIAGKALVLDEIINYVQSLQNQVEFLMAKLASVDPTFGVDGVAVDLIATEQPEISYANASDSYAYCSTMPPPLYTFFSHGSCYAVPMSTWYPLLQDKDEYII